MARKAQKVRKEGGDCLDPTVPRAETAKKALMESPVRMASQVKTVKMAKMDRTETNSSLKSQLDHLIHLLSQITSLQNRRSRSSLFSPL